MAKKINFILIIFLLILKSCSRQENVNNFSLVFIYGVVVILLTLGPLRNKLPAEK